MLRLPSLLIISVFILAACNTAPPKAESTVDSQTQVTTEESPDTTPEPSEADTQSMETDESDTSDLFGAESEIEVGL